MFTGCLSSQFLAVLVLFSVSWTSGENLFYLSLVPVSNFADVNATCSGEVRCACQESLMESRRQYQEELNATCAWFDEVEDPSEFSFCTNTLRRAGYEVWKENVSQEFIESHNMSRVDAFDDSMLKRRLKEMDRQLRIFRMVLDRTISGILIETELAKCFCFVSTLASWKLGSPLPFAVAAFIQWALYFDLLRKSCIVTAGLFGPMSFCI